MGVAVFRTVAGGVGVVAEAVSAVAEVAVAGPPLPSLAPESAVMRAIFFVILTWAASPGLSVVFPDPPVILAGFPGSLVFSDSPVVLLGVGVPGSLVVFLDPLVILAVGGVLGSLVVFPDPLVVLAGAGFPGSLVVFPDPLVVLAEAGSVGLPALPGSAVDRTRVRGRPSVVGRGLRTAGSAFGRISGSSQFSESGSSWFSESGMGLSAINILRGGNAPWRFADYPVPQDVRFDDVVPSTFRTDFDDVHREFPVLRLHLFQLCF